MVPDMEKAMKNDDDAEAWWATTGSDVDTMAYASSNICYYSKEENCPIQDVMEETRIRIMNAPAYDPSRRRNLSSKTRR